MGGLEDDPEDASSGGGPLWPAFMSRILGAQFPPKTPGKPKPQHAKVADQGPEGVTEGGRAVALDQGMAGPGQAVADDQPGNGQAPFGRTRARTKSAMPPRLPA